VTDFADAIGEGRGIIKAVNIVAPGRPLADHHLHRFAPGGLDEHGLFQTIGSQARYLRTGRVAMAWATSNITLQASPAPNLDLSVDEIEGAPGMPSATWPFWARYIARDGRKLLNLIRD
ncbi:unnamed protein product, partial [Prorocentrum cordatum]